MSINLCVHGDESERSQAHIRSRPTAKWENGRKGIIIMIQANGMAPRKPMRMEIAKYTSERDPGVRCSDWLRGCAPEGMMVIFLHYCIGLELLRSVSERLPSMSEHEEWEYEELHIHDHV